MGDKGDFEGLNPGCGVSWTSEPAGVAGRVARIAFASARTGVRRAEVSLEDGAIVANENDESRSSFAGRCSFIGHGARVTSAVAWSDDGIVCTTDEAGVTLAWRVTAGGTLEPAGGGRPFAAKSSRPFGAAPRAYTGIHEGMPSDAVAVAAAPRHPRRRRLRGGRVAVYEGEVALVGNLPSSSVRTSLTRSTCRIGSRRAGAGPPAAMRLSWFDAGAGCALLAVGVGSSVAAYARIPRRDGTTEGAEGADDGRRAGTWRVDPALSAPLRRRVRLARARGRPAASPSSSASDERFTRWVLDPTSRRRWRAAAPLSLTDAFRTG